MADDVHELSILYALDVLGADERTRFEDHLAGCESCRTEVASLRETSTALAYAAAGPAPPAGLKDRILAAAHAEGSNVVPLRPRRSFAVAIASAAAVAAAGAAVAVGIWAASLDHSLSRERATARILGDPSARRVQLNGTSGQLVVAAGGDAVLAVRLPALPKGKTYEAWVADPDVRPAGVFSGGTTKLRVPVRSGAQVMISIERAGGVDAPTTKPIVTARV